MKIHSLNLKNFRSFLNEQDIEFSSLEKKGVTLIRGAMGAGKTKLFGAIQWCLYAEEDYDEEQRPTNDQIMNSLAKKEEIAETKVELVFEIGGTKYKAIRKFNSYGGRVEEKSEFNILKSKPNGDWENESDPDLFVNEILPKNLRQYFMFDGEKIQNYSKMGHEIEIQNAIKGLLGFADIEEAIKVLGKIGQDYDKEIKEVTKSQELAEIIKKITELDSRLDDNSIKQENCEKEILSAIKQIDKLKSELQEYATAKVYIEKEKKLSDEYATKDQEIQRLKKDLIGDTDEIHLTMLDDVREKALKIYSKLEQKGEIPSPIRKEFILKIVQDELCICGRSLKKEDDEKALKKLFKLSAQSDTDLEKLVVNIPVELSNLKGKSDLIKQTIGQKSKQIVNLKQDCEKLNREIKGIKDFLRGSDEEAISYREKQIESVEKILESKKETKVRTTLDSEKIASELEPLNKRKEALELLDQEVQKIAGNQKKGKKLKQALSKFFEMYSKSTKESVRAETQKTFQAFMWKKDFYSDVQITDDYILDISDMNGRLAREGMSQGERQCFSLAFVIALANVTKKQAPFIIDTPLGRISKDPSEIIDPRVQILKTIPQLLGQIILFATYEEVRSGEATEETIKNHVGKEYKLEFVKDTGCTKIIPLS
jgi:DNA sulfur modification protein DndD